MLGAPVAAVRVRGRIRTRERAQGLGGWRGLLGAGLAIVALVAGTAVMVRTVPRAADGWVGGLPDSAGLAAAAADRLEAATAAGGTGYRFSVVQTAVLHQRTGGEPIPVVDPADPHKVTGTATEA